MTTIVMSVTAQPGKGGDLIKAFDDILPDTRKFDGCQGVTVHQKVDDPDGIVLIEKWDSAEHYAAYGAWRRESGTLGGLMSLAASRPDTAILNDL